MDGSIKDPYGLPPEPSEQQYRPAAPPRPVRTPAYAHPARPNKQPRKIHFRVNWRFSKKRVLIPASILLLIALSYLGYQHLSNKSPIPKSLASGLNITAYYPKKLPANYSLDTGSFTSSEGHAFSFNILHSGGQTIAVSEQVMPAGLSLSSPDTSGVQPETFQTPIGQAGIRALGSKRVGYITAANTLIIFNLSDTPATDFQAIAEHFTN